MLLLIVPPPLGGTVGEKTAMLNSFPPSQFIPHSLSLSADISPPPLSEILFLHRFEQEEVGRWSRQKRQACGPLTTSCSLFCDTKIVPRSVLRAAAAAATATTTTTTTTAAAAGAAALSPVRHSRRRNP